MANLLSPGVQTKEYDLTGSVTAAATSAAGFAAPFQWGPVNQLQMVTSESDLVAKYGKPTADINQFWFSAASFLAYSNTLYIARAAASTSKNATSSGTGLKIDNDDVWHQEFSANESTASGVFAARYPGALGNGIKVSVADSATYATWEYKDLFNSAPGTSDYAEARGGVNDEVHIVVVDVNGVFTGTTGGILETFAYASKGSDAKDNDGGVAYYKTVIYQQSSYVHVLNELPALHAGTSVIGTTFGPLVADLSAQTPVTQVYSKTLAGGVDGFADIDDGELQTAWNLFQSPETIDVAFLFTGPASVATSQFLIDNIAEVRKDLIVTISPQLADVRGAGVVTKVVAAKNGLGGVNRSTSYGVFDCNWKLVYDRYNEVNVWVPVNPDIAGLMARTDADRDPWWSPAGYERGVLKNVLKFAWNPVQSERDELYKNGVNPVLTFTGRGPILFGDKTMLTKTSAFDRINVRRLFIYIEKQIGAAAKDVLFELNDTFTRASFINAVTPFLRNIEGKRGLYAYKVVCDETNNTSYVVDANQFVATIMVSPARSINFIQLQYVATRTGQSFSEVTGSF